jgi:glycosyltransferase involved in cell wall biosynthesis
VTHRVQLIIPTLDRCGAEKQLTLLACGLPRDRFEVHVCALTRGGPWQAVLEAQGIPVTVIGKSWKFDPLAYLRLRRQIRRLRPDLVHTWIFAANAYGRQAAFSAGVPHVLAGERCVDPWKRWHELAVDRYLARRTERLITNSSGVRDFYVQRGIPADKWVIIPNGVEPAPPSTLERRDVLAELGLPAEAVLIGAVNRLWPQKRIKDLIWAADLLKCVRDDVHLLIIGDGPQRWRLERYRDQVQISDRVHFLGQRDDVPQLLPHLACLWLASGYEGQSNAILEAMAAGVPVVATDIPGNRDLVVHGETGFLVPVGDRGNLAGWTKQLLDDPELARRCGEAGRRRVASEFSIPRMIQRHVELYEQILAGTPA